MTDRELAQHWRALALQERALRLGTECPTITPWEEPQGSTEAAGSPAAYWHAIARRLAFKLEMEAPGELGEDGWIDWAEESLMSDPDA